MKHIGGHLLSKRHFGSFDCCSHENAREHMVLRKGRTNKTHESGALVVQATTDGGAVYATPAETCSFTSTIFRGNEAASAGGVLFADETATVLFKDTVVSQSMVGHLGNVVFVLSGCWHLTLNVCCQIGTFL
jgi:hypothetical protein